MSIDFQLDFIVYNVEGGFAGISKTIYIDGNSKTISEYNGKLAFADIKKGSIAPINVKTVAEPVWNNFVDKLSKIDFFSWKPQYKDGLVIDGMNWKLHLKLSTREMESSGSYEGAAPKDWEKFDDLLNTLNN